MSTSQTDYKAFRQRLDAVLRQTNPTALRDFLIAEGQWQQSASNDAEAAMWMMIAASTALADLHDEARRWLLGNGHEAEATAIFGRRSGGSGASRGAARPTKNKSQRGTPNQKQRGQEGSRGGSSTLPSTPRTPLPHRSDHHPAHGHQQPGTNSHKQSQRDPRVR